LGCAHLPLVVQQTPEEGKALALGGEEDKGLYKVWLCVCVYVL